MTLVQREQVNDLSSYIFINSFFINRLVSKVRFEFSFERILKESAF